MELLVEATEATMRYQPGYVSATIHHSLDGIHVVNSAQWRSQADFEAMLKDPTTQAHMRHALELARVEPQLYQVVYSDEGAASTSEPPALGHGGSGH